MVLGVAMSAQLEDCVDHLLCLGELFLPMADVGLGSLEETGCFGRRKYQHHHQTIKNRQLFYHAKNLQKSSNKQTENKLLLKKCQTEAEETGKETNCQSLKHLKPPNLSLSFFSRSPLGLYSRWPAMRWTSCPGLHLCQVTGSQKVWMAFGGDVSGSFEQIDSDSSKIRLRWLVKRFNNGIHWSAQLVVDDWLVGFAFVNQADRNVPGSDYGRIKREGQLKIWTWKMKWSTCAMDLFRLKMTVYSSKWWANDMTSSRWLQTVLGNIAACSVVLWRIRSLVPNFRVIVTSKPFITLWGT